MRQPRFPVMVDTGRRRVRAGFSAPAAEEPALISLRLREKGWSAYSIGFDPEATVWVAKIIDFKTKHAA
jgi:hypothetical protein